MRRYCCLSLEYDKRRRSEKNWLICRSTSCWLHHSLILKFSHFHRLSQVSYCDETPPGKGEIRRNTTSPAAYYLFMSFIIQLFFLHLPLGVSDFVCFLLFFVLWGCLTFRDVEHTIANVRYSKYIMHFRVPMYLATLTLPSSFMYSQYFVPFCRKKLLIISVQLMASCFFSINCCWLSPLTTMFWKSTHCNGLHIILFCAWQMPPLYTSKYRHPLPFRCIKSWRRDWFANL